MYTRTMYVYMCVVCMYVCMYECMYVYMYYVVAYALCGSICGRSPYSYKRRLSEGHGELRECRNK